MTLRHLVLLPGLDGTGELFEDFIKALPEAFRVATVSYPKERFLAYSELQALVSAATPQTERFVLVAESFSSPVALTYAATGPANLGGVVICAGFVRNPIGRWSAAAKAIAQPWLFRLTPPRFVLEHLLLGKNAPAELFQKFRQTLRSVSPEVLSKRVEQVLEVDAREELRRTKVPLMYLQAVDDKLLSATCRDDFTYVRPDTVFKVVPGPHLLLQREPKVTASLVAHFVEQLGLPPDWPISLQC